MPDIRIDTGALSYPQFLIPGKTDFLNGSDGVVIDLDPGPYHFQQWSGWFTSLTFAVTEAGTVDYPAALDGFLSGRGTTTLTVLGLNVTLDARTLDHDLLPMIVGASDLSRTQAHLLRLVPSDGYGFQPASGIVADFRFQLMPDGQVVIDPRFSGFAQGGPGTVTVSGYPVTIDARALSHDLLPVSMLGGPRPLPRAQVNVFTYIPAAGYGFQPASGVVADFSFELSADGVVSVPPRFGRFAEAQGRTLVVRGYPVTVDMRDTGRQVVPSLLGDQPALPPDRAHVLILIPASAHVFLLQGPGPGNSFTISVETDGTIRPLDVPDGAIVFRPMPIVPSMRSYLAEFFLPARASLRAFSAMKQQTSLTAAVRDHRARVFRGKAVQDIVFEQVDDRFSGGTSGTAEQEALNAMRQVGVRSADLAHVINAITWPEIDDELEESDVTKVIDHLRVLYDRDLYLPGFLVRWFYLIEGDALADRDFQNTLTPFATGQPVEVRRSFADQCLSQVDAILDGLGNMALRSRPTFTRELRLAIDTAPGPEAYRAVHLQPLSWQIFYTDLIGTFLAVGQYPRLVRMLDDLFNLGGPGFPAPVRNIALFNALRRWERHFEALRRAIEVLGTPEQAAAAQKYMERMSVFLGNFPNGPTAPPPAPAGPFLAALNAAIQPALAGLSLVGTTFQDLTSTTQGLVNTIDEISAGKLLGTTEDDAATTAANTLSTEGLLALLPFEFKSRLMARIFGGSDFIPSVVDEEEDAALRILEETKIRSVAEFLQVAGASTWEVLSDVMDGDQYDKLEGMFRF
ncbi:MAG: hypothetical protein ACRDRH_18390 [Pseudonocardia sp.]